MKTRNLRFFYRLVDDIQEMEPESPISRPREELLDILIITWNVRRLAKIPFADRANAKVVQRSSRLIWNKTEHAKQARIETRVIGTNLYVNVVNRERTAA